MYSILVVSVVALGIAIERFIFLFFKYNINANAFMAQIQKLVLANSIDRAVQKCSAEPNALLPRVLKAGLLKANDAEGDIQNAVTETTLEVGPLINKRIGYLGMLANVSTLLGLLGTIQGLIQAFDAVARASAETKQMLLAQGISIAMYTTFMGLVVAIPIMMLQAFIQARAIRILDDVDEFGLKLVNLLVARSRGALQDAGANKS